MSTVVYRNARVFIDGYEWTTTVSDLAVDYSAEMLDETAMGDDTRIKKGGLLMAKVDMKGHVEFGAASIGNVLFDLEGTDDLVATIYPDGLTEGSSTTGMGYAMKGTIDTFNVGAQVGALLTYTLSMTGRGIAA